MAGYRTCTVRMFPCTTLSMNEPLVQSPVSRFDAGLLVGSRSVGIKDTDGLFSFQLQFAFKRALSRLVEMKVWNPTVGGARVGPWDRFRVCELHCGALVDPLSVGRSGGRFPRTYRAIAQRRRVLILNVWAVRPYLHLPRTSIHCGDLPEYGSWLSRVCSFRSHCGP